MMFRNFFRRRKKKDVVKKEKKVRDAFSSAGSVGELLSMGKDVRVISVSFPNVKLGVKFSKGEVATLSDEARKLGVSEGDYFWRIDKIDVVRAITTELAHLAIDDRIIYLVKHCIQRPLRIDFIRRNESEPEKMDRIRRASLSAKKEGTVKIHHGRTKSIDDAVPVTKEEIQKAAQAGLRKSLLRKKSKNGLVMSGPKGAVRRKVELPRRKSKVEKKRIALPGLAIYDASTSNKNLIPVFMRHDNFTQSESQVALTFKHELRVPKTMTVRRLIQNLKTVSDGQNGMEVSNLVCLDFDPGKLTTRSWPDIAKRGSSIDHEKLSSKLLSELLPKIKIIMVDVMSHWDDDFAMDFGTSMGSKSEKNDGSSSSSSSSSTDAMSPILDQTSFSQFDRLKSWGWASSIDEGSSSSGDGRVASMSSDVDLSPLRSTVLSMDDKSRTESDFVVSLDNDVDADAFDNLDWDEED